MEAIGLARAQVTAIRKHVVTQTNPAPPSPPVALRVS